MHFKTILLFPYLLGVVAAICNFQTQTHPYIEQTYIPKIIHKMSSAQFRMLKTARHSRPSAAAAISRQDNSISNTCNFKQQIKTTPEVSIKTQSTNSVQSQGALATDPINHGNSGNEIVLVANSSRLNHQILSVATESQDIPIDREASSSTKNHHSSVPVSMSENPEKIDEGTESNSDLELEDLELQYQSAIHRHNEGASFKIFHVAKDLGQEEDRVLKKVIKLASEKRGYVGEVTSIEGIRIVIDSYYPRIKLQYKLNGKERDINILNIYKGERDAHARNIITRLFTDNFNWLSREAMRMFLEAVEFRRNYTKQKFVGEFSEEENRLGKTLVAVYSIIPNGTIQFVFVDIHYNEVSFNNYFLDSHRSHFPRAYEFYQKKFKHRLTKDQEEAINEIINAPQILENEEFDSDNEQSEQPPKPMEQDEVMHKTDELLKEGFEFYEDSIIEKQQLLERLASNEDYIDEQRMSAIKTQTDEMKIALDSYLFDRESTRKFYQQLQTGKAKTSDPDISLRLELVYKQLRMLRNQLESQLPIIAKKRELFKALDEASLVILEGETGSGKSTQLPQMLCEYYRVFRNPRALPIVLTQPRKIATRTLAERIAFEMGEQVHGFVDYVASAGGRPQRAARIVVKLDRLLLDELETDPLLSSYSCLVIDEAHERTISIDVIIGLVSNILRHRKDFKVIITSATLDASLFESHFAKSELKVQTFKIPGRLHRVNIIRQPYPQVSNINNKIYKCLTEEILADSSSLKSNFKGHVLCFCTGIEEINDLCDRMKAYLNMSKFLVIALHGKLTTDEQKIAFSESFGKSKIIFTTRIAETAITINNVKVVIDPGKDRLSEYDQKKKMYTFQMGSISQSAAKQRMGRAGRTTEGYCFRLYDEGFEKSEMKPSKTPQIDSVPLDTLVLRLKALKVANLHTFQYLSQPKNENLAASIESMSIIGCLDEKEAITPLGRAVMRIPIEPFLSRAILEGMIVEKLSPTKAIVEKIVKILAIISNNQSIFYSSDDSREICEKARFNDFAEPDGDFFSLLNVYEGYENEIKCGKDRVNSFLRQHFLSKKAIMQARDLIHQIMVVIGTIKLNPQDFVDYSQEILAKIARFNDPKELILGCLLTSFCQNLCLYSGDPQIGYTLLSSEQPVQVYGSSFLALQGISPKWLVCYDIIKTSNTYCRVAQTVSFHLLRAAVSPRVFRKYNLDQCEKANPFYIPFVKQLPTVVLKQLQTRRDEFEDDPQLAWFANANLTFDRDHNKLRAYVPQSKSNCIQMLDEYIEKLVQQLKMIPIKHSFLGNITAEMNHGCVVKKLYFYSSLFSVKITNLSGDLQELLLEQFGKSCESIETLKGETILTFSSELERDVFTSWKEKIGKCEPRFKQAKIEMMKDSTDKRSKFPTAHLKIVFWASSSAFHDRLLLDYPGEKFDNIKKTPTLMNEVMKYLEYYFPNLRFRISQKGNTITAFLNQGQVTIADEYDFEKELAKVYKIETPPLVHRRVIAFRKYDPIQSTKSLDYWIEQIQQRFERIGEEISEEDIRIRALCRDSECYKSRLHVNERVFLHQKRQRECAHHITDFTVLLSFPNSKVAEKFIEAYDGKEGVLGTEKLHTVLHQQQCIVRVPAEVFTIFRKKYLQEKSVLEAEYQGLNVHHCLKESFNKKTQLLDRFCFISCSGSTRQSVLATTQRIREVFTNFAIRIEPEKISRINRCEAMEQGARLYESIFGDVQMQFNFEIYFEYNMKNLRVYCDKAIFPRVRESLSEAFNQIKEYTTKIYYHGKNIHSVKKILSGFEKIQATISFSERCVYASGPQDELAAFRNQIDALAQGAKDDCQICFNVLSMPIRLLNCGHTYCTNCVIHYLRSIKEDTAKYPLMCPEGADCSEPISMHDLRLLLDYEELNRTCDRGVQNLVDNVCYHSCYTANCEQIFEVRKTEAADNMFECQSCNLSYCRSCKRSGHKGISCSKYSEIQGCQLTKEELVQLSIRKCGNCGEGIERNQGCCYANCRCGATICWKCNRVLDKNECEKHTSETCPGQVE